ncbi:MAG TPA: hypothetical protein VMZ50_04005 [Phycisphaerae bacterium]|nr:hypothetical protein [Phycisphaerae bacterium]
MVDRAHLTGRSGALTGGMLLVVIAVGGCRQNAPVVAATECPAYLQVPTRPRAPDFKMPPYPILLTDLPKLEAGLPVPPAVAMELADDAPTGGRQIVNLRADPAQGAAFPRWPAPPAVVRAIQMAMGTQGLGKPAPSRPAEAPAPEE